MPYDDGAPLRRHPLVRHLLFAAGWVSIGLGVIGIALPLLPTTPFLLLAAACFARSSPRFYRWLIHHRYLGPWIADYLEGRGVPVKAKVMAIALLWLGIGFSAWTVDLAYVRAILLACAVFVTGYILRQPTRR
ncbi:YbaN family protein [Pseudomonas matsuisoli]|uniref:Inner membrane protein n=1 Tax=Pseudomonas matsuisoli TaxID=1515666 RepID=A0A917PT69_9PSED|nr:YbaN family protein [Pseudomonas matsuisoli]GGJ90002.1 inner membrane protein [Pseudomonas matsuisoli]